MPKTIGIGVAVILEANLNRTMFTLVSYLQSDIFPFLEPDEPGRFSPRGGLQ